MSEPSNKPRLSRNKNSIKINFDYLEKSDFFSFSVLHNSKKNPIVIGKIITGRIIIDDDIKKQIRSYYTIICILGSLLMFILICLMVALFNIDMKEHIIGTIFLIIGFVGVSIFMYFSLSSYIKEIIKLKK